MENSVHNSYEAHVMVPKPTLFIGTQVFIHGGINVWDDLRIDEWLRAPRNI